MKVLVFGAGKQGRVAGCWLAEHGINVTYADVDRFNIDTAERLTSTTSPAIYIPNEESSYDLNYLKYILEPFDFFLSYDV